MLEAHRELGDAGIGAHHAWLLRLARRLAADEEQAEDLVQDAWTQLLARGAGAVRDLRAFLGGVVRVLAARERSAVRARARREARAAREEELPSTAVLAERLELARVLAEELARLPEAQRTLLLLHHQEGVTLAAIARRRGVPAGTVRAQITRARHTLRARLDARFAGRREDWAALALAGARGGGTPTSLGPGLTGGIAMHVSLKVALVAGALAGVGWLVSRSARAPERELGAGSSTRSTPALAKAPAPASNAQRERVVAEPPETPEEERRPAPNLLLVRVVDESDGRPLAHYLLRADTPVSVDGHALGAFLTDAAGELRLERAQLPEALELRGVDDPDDPIHGGPVRRIERAALPPEGLPLVLEFPSGPTYSLAFSEPPPAPDEVVFALRPGREPNVGFGFGGHMRAGELPWVRFEPGEANPSSLGGGPWTLTARDRAGFWIAWGEVRRIAGVQDEPVAMRTSARGVIHVEVRIDGAPIEAILRATAQRLEGGAPVSGAGRRLTLYPANQPGFPGSGGRGDIAYLEPGTYRVLVGGPGIDARSTDVEVRVGERMPLALDFESRAGLAAIDVVLRSQTGRAQLRGLGLQARGPDGGDDVRHGRWIERRSDGSQLYRFDALAPGEWELELDPTPHLPAWDRTTARARPAGEPVELVCLDAEAAPGVQRRVQLVDAVSGAPLALAGLSTYLQRQGHSNHTANASGEVLIGPYAVGQEVELHARAAGHAAALVALRMEDGEAPIQIALESGWGVLIEVVAPDEGRSRGRPLAGVAVHLDGVLAGTTDAHGRLLVAAPRRPARMDLSLAGYRLDSGPVDASTGEPDGQEMHPFRFVMRPVA